VVDLKYVHGNTAVRHATDFMGEDSFTADVETDYVKLNCSDCGETMGIVRFFLGIQFPAKCLNCCSPGGAEK